MRRQLKSWNVAVLLLISAGCRSRFVVGADDSSSSSSPSAENGSNDSLNDRHHHPNLMMGGTATPPPPLKMLNPSVCSYLDDTECVALDEQFELQSSHVRAEIKSSHSVTSLIVLVRWSNHVDRDLPTRDELDILYQGDENSPNVEEIIPTGSVQKWFDVNSYGKFQHDFVLTDWTTTNGTEAYYADGRQGLPSGPNHDLTDNPQLRWAYHYVLEQLDASGFDFSPFDVDGDGFLDSVQFLHSGYPASQPDPDCETGTTPDERIRAHAISDPLENRWTSQNGRFQLGIYSTASAVRQTCGANIARLGVITHELLHPLGLPDLYDQGSTLGSSVGGLGGFDIMSNPRGPKFRQAYPGHISAWCKQTLGWMTPVEIVEDGTYTMRPSELHADYFVIRKHYPAGEYLLIENRQPIEFDELLWTGGILIYHIDETSPINGNDSRGYPGQRGWPGNGKHHPVALLQSDGLYEVDRAISNGDAEDFWRFPNQQLGPGNGESVATDQGTYPNTDAYAYGNIEVTGITISNFRETNEPMVWSFDVSGVSPSVDDTASPTARPSTARPTPSPTRTLTPQPSSRPTEQPTSLPTTSQLTPQPSFRPTKQPTLLPTTSQPSPSPTKTPTKRPTTAPTEGPSAFPSLLPTRMPTLSPSAIPSQSAYPSNVPTITAGPSTSPQPTNDPSTRAPSLNPTTAQTTEPTSDVSSASSMDVGIWSVLSVLSTVLLFRLELI